MQNQSFSSASVSNSPPPSSEIIRAVTCDIQQSGILTSVDSDKPVQLLFKLRNSNDVQSAAYINNYKIFKRLAKALIRMRICTV